MLNYYIDKAEEQKLDIVTLTAFKFIIHDEKSLTELKVLALKNPLNRQKLKRWFYKHNPFHLLDIDNVNSYLFQEIIMNDLDFDTLANLINEVIEEQKLQVKLAKFKTQN